MRPFGDGGVEEVGRGAWKEEERGVEGETGGEEEGGELDGASPGRVGLEEEVGEGSGGGGAPLQEATERRRGDVGAPTGDSDGVENP